MAIGARPTLALDVTEITKESGLTFWLAWVQVVLDFG